LIQSIDYTLRLSISGPEIIISGPEIIGLNFYARTGPYGPPYTVAENYYLWPRDNLKNYLWARDNNFYAHWPIRATVRPSVLSGDRAKIREKVHVTLTISQISMR